MAIILSFFAGLALAGFVILTYPYWPRNTLGQNNTRWVEAYNAGTGLLSRLIGTRPGAPVPIPDGVEIKDAVLAFLVMCGRGRLGVMPVEALSPREERFLAIAHGARDLTTVAMRRACRRLPIYDRTLVERSREIYRMSDEDVLSHIQETIQALREQADLPAVLPSSAKAKPAETVHVSEAQDDEEEFDAVVGAGEILDLITAADPNPELWHVLVEGLDISSVRATPVIDWILRQQACDRATAALVLLRIDVASLMTFTTVDACPKEKVAHWHLAKLICQRSEGAGYIRTGLNLSCAGEDNDQSGLLIKLAGVAAEMLEKRQVSAWPLPETLLADDFVGSAPDVPYHVADGALVLAEREADRGAAVIDMASRRTAAA
ncbi:MAG: hypothetical protein AAFV19_18790 [Pseudomonadota bacterium]